MKKKNQLIFLGFLQALEVSIYCGVIGGLIWNIERFIDNKPNFFGPIAMLTLLCVSVLTCGLLVFYKPYVMFFDGKKKESINLVVYTTAWLLAIFIILLGLAFSL